MFWILFQFLGNFTDKESASAQRAWEMNIFWSWDNWIRSELEGSPIGQLSSVTGSRLTAGKMDLERLETPHKGQPHKGKMQNQIIKKSLYKLSSRPHGPLCHEKKTPNKHTKIHISFFSRNNKDWLLNKKPIFLLCKIWQKSHIRPDSRKGCGSINWYWQLGEAGSLLLLHHLLLLLLLLLLLSTNPLLVLQHLHLKISPFQIAGTWGGTLFWDCLKKNPKGRVFYPKGIILKRQKHLLGKLNKDIRLAGTEKKGNRNRSCHWHCYKDEDAQLI